MAGFKCTIMRLFFLDIWGLFSSVYSHKYNKMNNKSVVKGSISDQGGSHFKIPIWMGLRKNLIKTHSVFTNALKNVFGPELINLLAN